MNEMFKNGEPYKVGNEWHVFTGYKPFAKYEKWPGEFVASWHPSQYKRVGLVERIIRKIIVWIKYG